MDPIARRPAWVAATLAVLVALAACAPEGGGAPSSEGALPAGAPLAIEGAPTLAVGLVEGDTAQLFHRVVTPFLLPDGRLVVPLAGSGTLRLFGPEGAFLGSLGRPGEAPGEFGSLDAAWARGDTVEAFDGRLLRVTRFVPRGTVQVVTLTPSPGAQMAVPGVLADGWAVMGVREAGVGRRDAMVVHAYGRDGAHRGEITRVQGMARYAGGGFASGPEPLSPRAVFAVAGGAVWAGETLTPRVRVLGPEGRLQREITWDPGPGPSPAEALDLVLDSAVARAGPAEGAEVRRRLADAPVPERLPAFHTLIVDSHGYAWVRPYDPARNAALLGGLGRAGPGGRWWIFAPDGSPAGTVEVPDDLEPAQVTADAVVGIARDALGVESVRVHRLVRQGAG